MGGELIKPGREKKGGDFVAILEAHNRWRRGGDTAQVSPVVLGQAIDQAVAETNRLRAVEVLVNNLIDQHGRYNTQLAYDRLVLHMKRKGSVNEEI